MNIINVFRQAWALAILLATCSTAWAGTAVEAGNLIVEPATLHSIGVEWKIVGDDNANASVVVSYQRKGEGGWHKALPLLRIHHELVNGMGVPFHTADPTPQNPRGIRENPWHYDTGNMFAGSILNLAPDTEYECRFVLQDPDGTTGVTEKTITIRTRAEPRPATGGHVYHVYPIGWQGPKQEPAFTGLMRAYNLGAAASDHEHAYPPRVQPGDTILVHAGLYESDRFHYLSGMPHVGFNALAAVMDGTYYLDQNGTPDKPIVIKAAGDGEVIFDGAGNGNLFNLLRADYNYFEGITVRNTTVAFLLGWKGIAGSSGFTLKHSRIYNVGRAVQAEWSGSRDFYIADNVFIGQHDPSKMVGWTGAKWATYPGFPELLLSEYGLKIYGQGHVVEHNYVANWHDGIDISTYGEPDGTPGIDAEKISGPTEKDDTVAAAIDINNNDFYNMGDNCVEADGGVHNIRVFANRCFNTAEQALSAQPIFGGPAYFYRNLVYNAPNSGPLKLDDTPAGVLIFQNTFFGGDTNSLTPSANLHLRNNIFVGRGDDKPIYNIQTTTNYSSSDYNGFSLNKAPYNFVWSSPPSGVAADYNGDHPLTVRRFKTLKDFGAATGQDTHSVMLGYGDFVSVPPVDEPDWERLYNPEVMNFQLTAKSAAVDAGIELPTITDGYTGRAPDLGAYELGRPEPLYGPRAMPPGTAFVGKLGFRSWNGPPRMDARLISK